MTKLYTNELNFLYIKQCLKRVVKKKLLGHHNKFAKWLFKFFLKKTDLPFQHQYEDQVKMFVFIL